MLIDENRNATVRYRRETYTLAHGEEGPGRDTDTHAWPGLAAPSSCLE